MKLVIVDVEGRFRSVEELYRPTSRRSRQLDVIQERLDTLAANLAHAGQLCKAFEQGSYREALWFFREPSGLWEPGCGWAVP